MDLTESLLLVIAGCAVVVTVLLLAGVFLLLRYCHLLAKKINAQVELLEKKILPVAEEVRAASSGIKELAVSANRAVSNFAFAALAGRSSSKMLRRLAGIKIGMELVLKAMELHSEMNKQDRHL